MIRRTDLGENLHGIEGENGEAAPTQEGEERHEEGESCPELFVFREESRGHLRHVLHHQDNRLLTLARDLFVRLLAEITVKTAFVLRNLESVHELKIF